jgi:3-keto-5-aminohexanoate cleavage enzyme
MPIPDNRVIITVAQTGALVTKEMNPNLPEQPDEIAESAYACYNEGAAICHIHANDKNGKPTTNRDIFREIHERIHDKCNIIIQDSTSGSPDLTLEQKIDCLEANPEMASLNMGILFRTVGPYGGMPWLNPPEDIEYYARCMKEKGIKPEMEIYNSAMFREVENLKEKDLVEKPLYINLVLGMRYQGAVPATPKHLFTLLDFVPAETIVNVTAIGMAQLPLTTLGIILTGCIRVGMEDCIYYRKEELVKNNAQLVARTVKIARELNKEPATPEEARQIIGLKAI